MAEQKQERLRPEMRRKKLLGSTNWSTSRFESYVEHSKALELKPLPEGWLLRLQLDEVAPELNDEAVQIFCRREALRLVQAFKRLKTCVERGIWKLLQHV